MMKYRYDLISAQPEHPYFIWQLGVQLVNLVELDFPLSQYHILLGVRGQKELGVETKKLIDMFPDVNWHLFEDSRIDLSYIPSIRSHLLSKFYEKGLHRQKPLLLVEADIVFKSMPMFSDSELYSSKSFVADTHSYLSHDYVDSKGDGLLTNMCKIVGVNEQIVRTIQRCGGAQYLLKPNVNADVWRRVESSATNLYKYLNSTSNVFKEKSQEPEKYTPIQSWCSDMWCMLWILNERFGVEVKSELSFSWPTDDIKTLESCKILHNAGVTESQKKELFYKGDFLNGLERRNFSYVDSTKCSSFYLKYVEKFLETEFFNNFS